MRKILPPFTGNGLPPPGDYELTLDEIRESPLVVGPPERPADWDALRRSVLVDNLEHLCNQLWNVGISEIFIDGSFVTDKLSPGDIDGYLVVEASRIATRELQKSLNELEGDNIWTWDPRERVPCGATKRQLPMRRKYLVELFPHMPDFPASSGIPDEFGNDQIFPAAFRKTRHTYEEKGIVKVVEGRDV